MILTILGENYYGLSNELTLSVISSSIFIVIGLIFGVLNARGWPTPPFIVIGVNIIFIIAGIYLFDVSALSGVLKFNIFTSMSLLIVHGAYLFYKIKTLYAN
jgi:glucose uptake protein GlcU